MHWVGAWSASPSDGAGGPDYSLNRLTRGAEQTLRLVLTPHLGGDKVRIHLSNRFGRQAVRFARVTIARRRAGAALVPGSSRPVTFGGRRSVVARAGGDVVSDPVTFSFGAFEDVAVSIYLPVMPASPTEHIVGRQFSYATPPGAGDRTTDPSRHHFTQRSTARYFVDALDVSAPRRVGAVVAFGDSITDGFQGAAGLGHEDQTAIDRNLRYPDLLARRLRAARLDLTVLNAGISGNQVLASGTVVGGPSGLSRLDADVIASAGATDVIILEGINDINLHPGLAAQQLIDGYRQMVTRLHAAGLRVQLGTLTPDGSSPMSSGGQDGRDVRETVNEWIRSAASTADGVVDFDAAVRDPLDPDRLAPAYDGGDGLHFSAAGNAALAGAVSLSALARPRC